MLAGGRDASLAAHCAQVQSLCACAGSVCSQSHFDFVCVLLGPGDFVSSEQLQALSMVIDHLFSFVKVVTMLLQRKVQNSRTIVTQPPPEAALLGR